MSSTLSRWNLEDALFRELTTQAAAGDIPQAKVTLSAWPGIVTGIDYHDLNLKNDNSKIVRVVAPVLFNLVILTGRPEDVHHRLGVHHRTPDLGVRARLRLPTIFALQRKLLFRATIERLARSPNVLMIHGRPVLIPLADLACFWLHHEATGMARREGGARPRPQVATIGTTNTGAMDRVDEIGQILKDYPFIWLHVDAAWAGISFACPEYCEQSQLAAINEHAKSFCTNFHKGLVNFDATALWVCQRHDLIDALDVTPAFLRTKQYDAGQSLAWRMLHTLERGAVALVERHVESSPEVCADLQAALKASLKDAPVRGVSQNVQLKVWHECIFPSLRPQPMLARICAHQSYLTPLPREDRSAVVRLLPGCHPNHIETGRHTVPYTGSSEDRLFRFCAHDAVETELHVPLGCDGLDISEARDEHLVAPEERQLHVYRVWESEGDTTFLAGRRGWRPTRRSVFLGMWVCWAFERCAAIPP
ncbi:pyridoxal-dependent decarboxylase conserved domain-containing protein [Epithele typhae]|uniref:pyridoxal-dependent decarboxylase conserved domain-containing protein n=1 Tax=Epithele typhae TaxID=378194 RepID=UPI002007BB5F|nr:pyridoxal-dependent decarboxylase conserved domain-containing protein [Epithele typhae]KAH9929907.1 pyridoxal-dependent decarboxylase conserved domain-containing protein [Epithele typhae]